MIKVGLTGGIGSGKTTVAKIFETLGIPVFYADTEAKVLLDESEEIKSGLINLFGAALYADGKLNRKELASHIFNDKEAIQKVNSIVHPAVTKRFEEWRAKQKATYVLQEAAILFETGGYKRFDKNILVSAPKEIRIKRIMQRDGLTEDEILARMQNQWDENHKIALADFVILNDESEMLLPQILRVHEDILRFANKKS
jgi:dephospho-CoA kinase